MNYKLIVDRIQGVRIINPYTPVIIRDPRGIIFYSTEGMTPRIKQFNLPPGEYLHNGNITLSPDIVKQKLIKMPPIERKYKVPSDFKIVFERNPSKCTIYWMEKKIVFDNSFKMKPIPYVLYILYHEYGHSFYKTEHLADLYASNMMKRKGYNVSQIGFAQLKSLSPAQNFRKNFLIDQLIKAES